MTEWHRSAGNSTFGFHPFRHRARVARAAAAKSSQLLESSEQDQEEVVEEAKI